MHTFTQFPRTYIVTKRHRGKLLHEVHRHDERAILGDLSCSLLMICHSVHMPFKNVLKSHKVSQRDLRII